MPFLPYGTGRSNRIISTLHFYVDDYRFSALWKNPAKIIEMGVHAAVEPNYSLFETTPLAFGLQLIYMKRWMARYWQENGISIYVDLNVAPKFEKYNLMGIPEGYNAFATRGTFNDVVLIENKYRTAQEISGKKTPNLIVYGGGKAIKDFCLKHSILYLTHIAAISHVTSWSSAVVFFGGGFRGTTDFTFPMGSGLTSSSL